MRWLKRIALTLVVLLLLGGIAAIVLYSKAKKVPAWYSQAREVDLSDPHLETNTVVPMQNWAAAGKVGRLENRPDDARRHTVTFTANQINGLLVKWSETAGFRERLEHFLQNIRVNLVNGNIVIAGESEEYGGILSISITPVAGPDGYTRLTLEGIRIGDVKLPLVGTDAYKEQLQRQIQRQLAGRAHELTIDERGVASDTVANAYFTSLLLKLLTSQPADAYAFLGTVGSDEPLATRVRDVEVQDGRMRVTLEMLTPEQREALLQQLKRLAEPPAK